ncbi:HAD family hydrolase [Motilimonas pumila]|uniref:HAD family hydrolase n=1 Tax=Motilimonas pumila TaxID=2303987 RepID=UPI001314E1CE|nr:HAD-IA family hydrolase [Motilimonas pumila]
MNKDDIDWVLFDLGGVLVQLNGLPFKPEWFNDPSQQPILHEWGISEVVRNYETGKASVTEFAQFTLEQFQLKTSIDAFIDEFTRWPGPLFDGSLVMLEQLGSQVNTAIYSNTNGEHWPRLMQEMALADTVKHAFASHLIGLAKPDLAGFKYVLAQLNTVPERVLFLDDNKTNVEAAASLGVQAQQVQGIKQVIECLQQAGFTFNSEVTAS